ncbi:M23 family metallopeptidase [Bradyrhizobium sp. B124]|uniref:M23 family metallopeptidase n=1 Tax=Bradyrhizobium sp. B124 TaxID=3140245 RepID=UPI0031840256
MSWQDTMRRILPPLVGIDSHVTSRYGEVTNRPLGSTNPHRGVDFNYNIPGQLGLNLINPALRSPVAGVVTQAGGGRYGTIAIRDADGFSHEILHSHSQHVSVGDPVAAGQFIGTMGNTGASSDPKKANHVHYQLRDPAGRVIDPSAFWDQQGPFDPNPAPPAHVDDYRRYLRETSRSAAAAAQGRDAPGADPDDNEDVRRLVRVSPQTAAILSDRMARPATMPNELPDDQPASFESRFGNWTSSGPAVAPRGPYQAISPNVYSQSGIVLGNPTTNYPFPTSIRGFANEAGAPDEWAGGRLRSPNWKRTQ